VPTCVVTATPEVARRAAQTFWLRKWRTGFRVFALSGIACLIATIIWLVALFGWQRAALAVPATILTLMVAMEGGSLLGFPRALARAAVEGNSSEVQVENDGNNN
jgi:hypothetical protein